MSSSGTKEQSHEAARRIAGLLANEGDADTAVHGLSLFRRDTPEQPSFCLVEPSIILVVQGVKQIVAGGDTYQYDTSRFLITSLNLPARSQAIVATPQQPCLGLMLRLDMQMIAELAHISGELVPARQAGLRGMETDTVTPQILDPVNRLLALTEDPDSIPFLAPLIKKEIHYRLMKSSQAQRLKEIASVQSHGYRIAKAIAWLKLNYHRPMKIDELAAKAQMSRPTFHLHFRELTSMSPLQYQKWLRLTEAKRLMLNDKLDAATASWRVGYESPSQFSREYRRLFGSSPRKDTSGHEGPDGA